MTCEKDANSYLASRFENSNDFIRNLLAILDLFYDPDLHVIHNQSQPRWIANVVQFLRNIQSECPLHDELHLTI